MENSPGTDGAVYTLQFRPVLEGPKSEATIPPFNLSFRFCNGQCAESKPHIYWSSFYFLGLWGSLLCKWMNILKLYLRDYGLFTINIRFLRDWKCEVSWALTKLKEDRENNYIILWWPQANLIVIGDHLGYLTNYSIGKRTSSLILDEIKWTFTLYLFIWPILFQ